MPGVATHIAIANIVVSSIDESIESEQQIKDIIAANKEYFNMGALGPDMLFFAPDYGDEIKVLLENILSFYDGVIEPIEELYEEYIEPITDVINDAEEILDEELCGLLGEIGDGCSDAMENVAKVGGNLLIYLANESFNVFDKMQPAIQKGESEESWYWFDMLHYRKTGAFAKRMWDQATTDKERAYVLGYSTHIAADVTGHPYVNIAVGGPARSHNQRHHFVENMIDTWVYQELFDIHFTESNIHKQLPCSNVFDESNGSILNSFLRQADEIPSELDDIFSMLEKSMKETFVHDKYPDRIAGRFLDKKDFNFAYFAILASLKSSSSSYISKPENPTEDMLGPINDAMQEFLKHASNPPVNSSSSTNTCTSFWNDDCDFSADAFKELLENIWENITYLGELALWIGQLLKDLSDMIICAITTPIKLLVKSLLWILQSTIYAIAQELRQSLVLSALLPPEPEWLKANPIAQTCVSIKDRGNNDGIVKNGELYSKHYPHRAQESNEGFLAYPKTPLEADSTYAGPYAYNSTPLDFILNAENNIGLYMKYKNSLSPNATKDIQINNILKPIGSSVDVAKNLMNALVSGNDIPDWNLDADRGFGYKVWTEKHTNQSNPLAWDSNKRVDESYI